MEGVSEERDEEKFVRKSSGKSFKSRKHDKAEKRKQRKNWEKRKRQRQQTQNHVLEKPAVEEKLQVPEEIPQVPEDPEEIPEDKLPKHGAKVAHLSRGKRLVELSRKRKMKDRDEEIKTPRKVRKPTKGGDRTKLTVTRTETNKAHNFKELDKDLLTIDETEKIGSGTFGRCFTAIYRNQYRVVVKEMKLKDSSKREIERAKQEVLNEASVLADLGDHPGIPHLFGVCSIQAPFCLVLQHLAVEGSSVTLSKAAATGIIANVIECAEILGQICEVLLFMHNRGYLHNDLKGNNVVLDGASHKAFVIDFGKSRKISKAKLMKPKVIITDAAKKYPHIAPEIHRGDRQSTASDVYSFGVLALKVLQDGKFVNPALKSTAKRCLSSNPGKRPKLEEILESITI